MRTMVGPLWAVVCMTLALAGPACGDLAAEADAVLASAVEEHNLVGISAAVGRDGAIVWSGGAGYADLENEVLASAGMVSRIASISKPMAAVAAMRLVEEGVLDLDAPIQTYYPEYPEKPWPVTLRHLLNHTSGTRHYNQGESGTMTHYMRLKEAARVFQDDDLLFEPGAGYQYTTYGYTLLGCVIEGATGKWFKDIMADHVWAPAGMTSTALEEPQVIVPKRARGYSLHFDRSIRNARYDNLSIKYPGGGMISSAEDLARFAMAFDAGALVSAETVEVMLQPTTLGNGEVSSYGFGWGTGNHSEYGTYFMHSGGQLGASTRLVMYREHGVAVAVMSNLDGGAGVVEVMDALAALFVQEGVAALTD